MEYFSRGYSRGLLSASFEKDYGTALVIGLVLSSIDHLDEVLRGQAVVGTWIKGALTCLVPFCVANWGILIATRRHV
jgi:hypothetical protein